MSSQIRCLHVLIILSTCKRVMSAKEKKKLAATSYRAHHRRSYVCIMKRRRSAMCCIQNGSRKLLQNERYALKHWKIHSMTILDIYLMHFCTMRAQSGEQMQMLLNRIQNRFICAHIYIYAESQTIWCNIVRKKIWKITLKLMFIFQKI